MKIKKLDIFSFGKFTDKSIELKDGINLIFGNNESGKSTITSFIEGIFYGFSKNSLKRRLYFDEYEKYIPWNSESYRGSIDISYDGENFRIERDFKEDKISILNLNKHIDLSEDPKNFSYSRVAQPGLLFFDMSSDLYKSTFLIRQLKTRIDEESAKLVKDKIENFILTNDKDINWRRSIDLLEDKLEILGKETRSKSEIGSLSEKINKLNYNILELEGIDKKVSTLRAKIRNIDRKIKASKEKQELNKKLQDQKEYQKLLDIKGKIDLIKSNIKDMTLIDPDDFQRAIKLEENYESLKKDQDNLILDLNSSFNESDDSKIDEVNRDKEKIRRINARLNDLNSINYSKESEILYSELSQVKTKIMLYGLAIGLCFLLSILSIYFIFSKKLYFLILGPIIFAIYGSLRTRKLRVQKDLYKRINDRILDYKKKSFEKTKEKRKIDLLLEEMYKKYGSDNFISLQNDIEKLSDQKNQEAYISKLETEKKNRISKKLEAIKNASVNIKRELDEIYRLNSVNNFNEIKDKFKSNEEYSKQITRVKILENEFSHILGDRKISDLDHKIDLEGYDNYEKDEDLNSLNIQRVKLEEELKYNDVKFKNYINLLEEKSNLENKLKEKLEDKSAIEKSIGIISQLIEENKQDLFPKIVSKMSYYLSQITNDTYKDITIDKNFNIKLYDSNLKSFVDLNNLSSGTIDQVYLSLRLSIISLADKNYPIILDDHFLQYDDKRLRDSLKFLKDLDNQLIIFSATKRERKVLDDEEIEYNLIEMEKV